MSFDQTIYNIVEGILSILPDSPFKFLETISTGPVGEILRWVNWFVPVYAFVGIFQAWLAAIAVYYVYQIVLRWANAIS